MSRFRSLKAALRPWLRRDDWSPDCPLPSGLVETSQAPGEQTALANALFACLPEGGDMSDRAAFALGSVLARQFESAPEETRNIIRRFMWHMNEESGNIGWGIPEAFGQTLAQSRPLADLYHRVLFSYILDKDGDNTWCDHAPLRLSCYKAVGIVLEAWPDLLPAALPALRRAAVSDPDPLCRQAASALLASYEPQGS